MGHILGVGCPWSQGLEGGRCRLGEPASTEGSFLCHSGSRDLHVKAGRTCGEKKMTELQRPSDEGPGEGCDIGDFLPTVV